MSFYSSPTLLSRSSLTNFTQKDPIEWTLFKVSTGDLLETQVIAMTNEDVTKVNVAIQKHLDIFSERFVKGKFKGIEFKMYEGSKVLLNENQYKTLLPDIEEGGAPVYNGNIGMVKKIAKDYMIIDFAGIGEVGIESEKAFGSSIGSKGFLISSNRCKPSSVLCQ